MLPTSLALVDDDREYAEFLAQHLVSQGVQVQVFADSGALLAHPRAFEFGFYVVDLMLPGIDGLELIKVLRMRSRAGLLVVSGRSASTVFDQVITVGADMFLAKPVKFNQVVMAIRAVQRRVVSSGPSATAWTLDRRARQLVAPDGGRVDLSESDLLVLECFAAASGAVVEREALRRCLARDPGEVAADAITSTIYRLRRRIERATPAVVPLQSISRVGYAFRAPLNCV
jgi:DNA-binding response OmpR family regulator